MIDQQQVTRVCVEYGVVLITEDGSELRLSCPFSLSDRNGSAPPEVDPEHVGTHAELIVGLVHQTIVGVDIVDTGELRLRLASGGVLTCRPDDRYEAWTLTLATQEMFVCQPGGGVAHWPPRA